MPKWMKEFQLCSKDKITPQLAAAVEPIAVPLGSFSHIHVDLAGPLSVAADGSTYLLTISDRNTHLLEAGPEEGKVGG